jgi:hypothetical protein
LGTKKPKSFIIAQIGTLKPLTLARPYQNPFLEGKMPFLAKISDGFERWLSFLHGIFDGEKDQILIQA